MLYKLLLIDILIVYNYQIKNLKCLTGDMNYIEHLVTVRCSSGKPWNLALTWMYQPTKHVGRPSKPSHCPTLPSGSDLPAGQCHCNTEKTVERWHQGNWQGGGLHIPQIPVRSGIHGIYLRCEFHRENIPPLHKPSVPSRENQLAAWLTVLTS